MNSVSTRSRRARARPRRRSRKRKRRDRLAAHAVLFDQAGMLRPLGELDSLLKHARASAGTRTTVFRIAQKLWQSDGVPQLNSLSLEEFIDTSDAEEEN